MLAVWFSVDAFRQVEKVALCAYFSEIFFFFLIMNGCQLLSKAISAWII